MLSAFLMVDSRCAMTSSVSGQGGDALLDLVLVFRVGEGSGLVQDHDGRILQQHPGDGDALLLTAGQPLSGLARRGVVALRQLGDELLALRGPGGGLHLLIGGGRVAQTDVFQQGTAEEVVVLGDEAHQAGQLTQRHRPHVCAAHRDAAVRHVPETGDELGHRGLAAAGRPHQRGEAALRQGQVDAMQDFRAVGTVGGRFSVPRRCRKGLQAEQAPAERAVQETLPDFPP